MYGVHPVEEVIGRRPRALQELIVSRDARVAPLIARAEHAGVSVRKTSREELSALCGSDSHQGVVAVVGEYTYVAIEDLLEPQQAVLLVVDGVTDPQNLGSMFRSALVLGATGVVLPRDRCVGVTPTVVRVSSGATEHLPCAQVTNLVRAIEQMKQTGVWVGATVESGGQLPEAVDLDGRLALVLGNEHRGVRPLVRRACDFELTIPSGGRIASLNVAAATAALFAEVARQRRQRPGS